MHLPQTRLGGRGASACAGLVGLALSLVLGSAGSAAGPNSGATPVLVRSAPPASPDSGFRLRVPSRHQMLQFYAELRHEGWEGAQIAAIFTGYERAGAAVKTVGTHFATFYGDLDGDRRPEWVVGCYFPSRSSATAEARTSSSMMGRRMIATRDDRARIVIFKQAPGEPWKVDWISPGLGYEFHAPDYNLREVTAGLDQLENLRLPLSLCDIDGDRRPEIVYQCWSESPVVGALPGIYRFDGSRWVGVAPQADRFSLRDVDVDGKLEVITGSRYVGYGSGDDDVPLIWRWTGRQYHEASVEFPSFYADLTARYRSYVAGREKKGEPFDRAAWERAIRKATSLSG